MKKIIICVVPFVVMASCLAPPRKMTNLTSVSSKDPDLKKGYQVGHYYTTKLDLLIRKDQSLVKQGGSEPFIEQYKRDPKSYSDVLGVIPAGTRIKVTRIMHYEGSGIGAMVITYGEIGAGLFRGKEVDLFGVSDLIYGTKYGPVNKPDAEIMTSGIR